MQSEHCEARLPTDATALPVMERISLYPPNMALDRHSIFTEHIGNKKSAKIMKQVLSYEKKKSRKRLRKAIFIFYIKCDNEMCLLYESIQIQMKCHANVCISFSLSLVCFGLIFLLILLVCSHTNVKSCCGCVYASCYSVHTRISCLFCFDLHA